MRMLENLDYYRYKSILHLNFTQILGILLYINDVILDIIAEKITSVYLKKDECYEFYHDKELMGKINDRLSEISSLYPGLKIALLEYDITHGINDTINIEKSWYGMLKTRSLTLNIQVGNYIMTTCFTYSNNGIFPDDNFYKVPVLVTSEFNYEDIDYVSIFKFQYKLDTIIGINKYIQDNQSQEISYDEISEKIKEYYGNIKEQNELFNKIASFISNTKSYSLDSYNNGIMIFKIYESPAEYQNYFREADYISDCKTFTEKFSTRKMFQSDVKRLEKDINRSFLI